MAGSWDGSYDGGQSDDSHLFERRHMDPIYDTFLCPLTKKVMRDPVTLETGQTFEREAIERWFRECRESGKKLVCPLTSRELRSTDLNPSLALRRTIEQWTARNEAIQLEIALGTLSMGNSDTDILQVLNYVKRICLNNQSNKSVVRDAKLIPKIVDQLRSSSLRVRCKALETLRIVAEDDDDNKEILAQGDTVRTIVKHLWHELSRERAEAVSLLYELSKSIALCEKIGSVNGAVLILVGMTSSQSENVLTSEMADKTLENLERCESNVRQMAEYGRLQPLLALILGDSPETKLSMTAYLGELVISNEVKVLVARTVGSSLIQILKSGNMKSREAALKSLNQISSYEKSARLLLEAGILPPIVKDLFTVGPNQLPMRLKEVAATILANVVTFGHNFDKIPVGPGRQTLVSEDIIHNLLHLISNTGPAIECKLLQVLEGLTNSASTTKSIVSAISSSGAMTSLVQFIDAPQKELCLASVKLLQNISPYMGQELADCLRGMSGQLSSLVKVITEDIGVTEEQAAAVGLLADLPERDFDLTKQMLDDGAFQRVISRIYRIRQGETRGNRFVTPYLEGLVRVLARITLLLSEETNAIYICRENNVAALFTDLLQSNGLGNIQMVSAMALENMSHETIKLTELPEPPASRFCVGCFSKQAVISGLCQIHRGKCSLKETFCLLDGLAVERLVALLDHSNEKLVEASLTALCTLLTDDVDIGKAVIVFIEEEAVKPILNVLLERRNLRRKAVWAVERFLRTEDIAIGVAEQPNLIAELVDAFRHGDTQTRQIAERALKHVDRIPIFSDIYSKPELKEHIMNDKLGL
ncbi:hypothetical protein QQ045_029754 [Rhodiola kirilowii]